MPPNSSYHYFLTPGSNEEFHRYDQSPWKFTVTSEDVEGNKIKETFKADIYPYKEEFWKN